jgi:hypothetical protein
VQEGYVQKPLNHFDLDKAFNSIEFSKAEELKRVLLIEDVIIHQEIISNLLSSFIIKMWF